MSAIAAAKIRLAPADPRTISFRPKKRRRQVQKSFSGCVSCKGRKIKCDETKPSCLRCTEKGKACPGFPTQPRLRWSQKHEQYSVKDLATATYETTRSYHVAKEVHVTALTSPRGVQPAQHGRDDFEANIEWGEDLFRPKNSAVDCTFDMIPTANYEDLRNTFTPLEPLRHSSVEDEDTNCLTSWLKYIFDDSVSDFCDTAMSESLYQNLEVNPGEEKSFIAIPPPMIDLQSKLVETYFTLVCPIFSTFDSQQNLFRSFVGRKWQNSSSMFFAIMSMAAGKLGRNSREYKVHGIEYQSLALRQLHENLSLVNTWTPELVMVILMLGLSTCWHNLTDLGLSHFRAMQFAVLNDKIQCSCEESEILEFFAEALIYWEMVTSYVPDMNSAPKVEYIECTQSPTHQPITNRRLCSRIASITPHPWTGVASKPQKFFTRIVRLICRSRSALINQESSELPCDLSELAMALEDEIWKVQLPSLHEIADTGDASTPAVDHLLLAEAYMFANCYQLYHSFPDLWRRRSNKLGGIFTATRSAAWSWIQNQIHGASSSVTHLGADFKDWLTYLGRSIIIRLQQISVSSRTSCVQPLLLLVGSTSLCLTSTLQSFEEDCQTTRTRNFVLDRLLYFSMAHYSEPTDNVRQVVTKIFDHLDGGQSVFWMDVLDSTGLMTIIG